MESWRISGETVASAYIGIPKKLVLTLTKRCCSNRIDGVAKGNEARQPKSSFVLPCLFMQPATRGLDLG